MKATPAGYTGHTLYEIPELEETEFALSVSPCPRIEDANDCGHSSDSFSIAAELGDELSQLDD